jgi:ubiquinone/menaquinone biosynthesis C-methylase UbiE
MNQKTPMLRVLRTKEEAKANYDRLSGGYDVLAGLAERRYKEAGLQKLELKNGEKVLEIGYGTGQCILPMARSVGVSGKVYGIDLSEGMYRVAKLKVGRAGLSARVELACGDATQLPYDGNSMDAIFASFTLELFDTPEIPVVLGQCQKVIHPGGRICIVGMAKKDENNLMTTLYEWVHEKIPRTVDCRPIHAQEALKEAGFEIVDVTGMSMFGLPVEIILARTQK